MQLAVNYTTAYHYAEDARRIVQLLRVTPSSFAGHSGRQGPADRMARQRLARMQDLDIGTVFQGGLHEWLQAYVRENAALDQAIAKQFRFS